jgi:hypothetical protein
MACRRTRFIAEVLQASDQLLELAAIGQADDVEDADDGCAVLCGVVRDCAYKMRARAELEREIHRSMGTWDEQTERIVG